jgi:hypothetical protein
MKRQQSSSGENEVYFELGERSENLYIGDQVSLMESLDYICSGDDTRELSL